MTNRTDALNAADQADPAATEAAQLLQSQTEALEDIANNAQARGLFTDALRDFARLEDWDYEAQGYTARETVMAAYRYEVQATAELVRACPGWIDQLVEAVAFNPDEMGRWRN